ncbi:hypothetical protein HUJ05_002596 [Dendroctonus ponderosae]|nr:hypothetical protein HUJ05_002596 [Dendroctonus ponderosae]
MGQTESMLDGPNTDKVITKDKKQMVDCSTQTVDERNFHSLSSGLTYKQLEEIKNRVWDSSVFTNTEIKEGNPLNTKDTCPKILLLGPDETGLDKGLHKAFVQYFPDLQDIVEDVGTQEDLFEKMRAIKKETTGDEFIAMHETNFCKVEELRKIIETVFHGSNSIVVLYVKNTKTLGESNKREKKSFAFIVQKENQDYKEILKEVKDTLMKKNAENDIESFRSTKDGALLITTKKDPTIAEKICGALNGLNKLGNSIKFKQLGIETNKESFFIRGIDTDTDKNQIMRDLEKVFVGLTQENTSLGELRPLSNDTQTVTLTCSDEKIIKELSARTRVKIGWVYCRLEPRLKVMTMNPENVTDRVGKICVSPAGRKAMWLKTAKTKKAALFAWRPGTGRERRNVRGSLLEDFIASDNLFIVNEGGVPTFSGPQGESHIDFTATTSVIGKIISGWRVATDEENFNFSDHRSIYFALKHTNPQKKKSKESKGWLISQGQLEKFSKNMKLELEERDCTPDKLVEIITSNCNKYLRPKIWKNGCQPVYWWNKKISEKRKECNRLRRLNMRQKQKGLTIETLNTSYKDAKKSLKKEINKSKSESSKRLRDQLEENVWGKAYGIITKRMNLKNKAFPDKKTTEEQIQKLFPREPLELWNLPEMRIENILTLEMEELMEAVDQLKVKKAPGPDQITPEIMKSSTLTCSDEKMIKELSARTRVKIGWVYCRLEPRLKVRKCFRCWGYDQEPGKCNGPSRQDLCFSCGEKGHVAQDCQNQESCPDCMETGHRAGTAKCKVFKRTLSKARRNYRQSIAEMRVSTLQK